MTSTRTKRPFLITIFLLTALFGYTHWFAVGVCHGDETAVPADAAASAEPAASADAPPPDTLEALRADADILWTCLAAFLVFFMQAGFAMVEVGFTRAKNACNIIMKI